MGYKSDIEIAQETKLQHISEVARTAGIDEKYLEYYGNNKAKVSLDLMKDMQDKPNGKLILAAITPTPAEARRQRPSASATPFATSAKVHDNAPRVLLSAPFSA